MVLFVLKIFITFREIDQETGHLSFSVLTLLAKLRKNRPRNDWLCVGWDVKPYSLAHSRVSRNSIALWQLATTLSKLTDSLKILGIIANENYT